MDLSQFRLSNSGNSMKRKASPQSRKAKKSKKLKSRAKRQFLEILSRKKNIDYEKTMRNSLKKLFPHSKLDACWFHFTQAVKKHLNSHNWRFVSKRPKKKTR